MKFQIEDFGVDLTLQALTGRLDPVFGRDSELARVVRVLVRKTKNNPVLLGEPGVGKTAIVEGLAQQIVTEAVPSQLRGVTVFSLNLGSLLAGTGYRGDFEQRLQDLVTELRRPGARRILFIDELHLLGRAGKSEGGLDAGNLLKPLLARGELPCIGASTPAEWQELVSADPALERRFQPVVVGEPSPGVTLGILRALRSRFESHHELEIADEALQAAVDCSASSCGNRRFPDKAIDLLDEACAMVRLSNCGEGSDAKALDSQRALEAAIGRFDLENLARIRRALAAESGTRPRPVLEAADVARVRGSEP